MPYIVDYYTKNKDKYKIYYQNYKSKNKKLCTVCGREYLHLDIHELSNKHMKTLNENNII